ncbi:MAG TPA: biopolymer transporter ExbD [Gemmatimonadaceae bacterium]|nr:biopolymer transporter ExbD [Gemmatimonadaceae bacterium]
MPIARTRLNARRREFARTHGPLNLIPLVDILTAIVFFSLLGAVSLRSALASFDLVAPSAAGEAGEAGNVATRPDLVVRVDRHQFVVRDGRQVTAVARPDVRDQAAFAELRHHLIRVTETLGRPPVITVVPSDDVSYDDVVRVLEQLQQVSPAAVALGSRARVPHD